MKKEFDVYFSGEVLEGFELDEVKAAVGRIFKIEGPQLEALFSGKPVRIKKNLSVERAGKFRKLFRDSGALVQIVPAGAAPPDPAARPTPPPRPEPPAAANPFLKPAAPQKSVAEAESEAGASPPPEPPQPVQYDTGGLSLAPLDDSPHDPRARETPETDLPDISHLQVLPQEQSSLEDCAPEVEPVPIPNIDRLTLDDPD